MSTKSKRRKAARANQSFSSSNSTTRLQPSATDHASNDARIVGLPVRDDVQAYCGTLVRNADGTPFGSLCHFDHVPQPVSQAEIFLLERFAPALARTVATEIF